ncbi:DUF4912 domain-containing protein [Novipirellula artificiosorum]|uniref:Rho termination factor-like N-terminal domain-containing protein n=1 Tax=Novipirellula artificiosorum TaxID=2528016 RepID=A0A5C6D4U9_9BACT|nr:DUF4912 domain-containing protein [Novipirellula artificiosorum]TWU30964.1 hypothetical protein Poly41_64330 [Novipirellula artificiosorum]
MIKTADLKAQTRRELAELAKNYGVEGWHGMRKDDLVTAISKVQRRLRRKADAKNGTKSDKKKASPNSRSRPSVVNRSTSKVDVKQTPTPSNSTSRPAPSKSARIAAARARTAAANSQRAAEEMSKKEENERISAKTARIRAQMRSRRETMQQHRDLSTGTLVGGSAVSKGANRVRAAEPHQDRVVLLVRDSYWLQASWEITRASVQRAESAMAERWHSAKPMLRLLAVGDISNNRAEVVARDIPIHGGVDNWYIDVDEPPARFRVVIGYLADTGDFYTLCRSNVVETPNPGECERLDEHWSDIAEDYERIYSLSGGYDNDAGDLKEVFEDRLQRPMPSRGDQGQMVADPSLLRQTRLPFKVDAELIVFGKTTPNATVSIAGRPVKLQADGSFTVRMKLPDKRQVLPVTAESRDGLRQRTTVVAVERNTKVMETVELDDRF